MNEVILKVFQARYSSPDEARHQAELYTKSKAFKRNNVRSLLVSALLAVVLGAVFGTAQMFL